VKLDLEAFLVKRYLRILSYTEFRLDINLKEYFEIKVSRFGSMEV
jgi:hypothetical protein